jgi:hypothetical protein
VRTFLPNLPKAEMLKQPYQLLRLEDGHAAHALADYDKLGTDELCL